MSEATGFTIAYGTGQITVADVKETLWFGKYHGGSLAIYRASLETDDKELADMITMVCIYYDPSGADFVMSSHYVSGLDMNDIVADLQTRVIIKYHQAKAAQAVPINYVPGPATLQ